MNWIKVIISEMLKGNFSFLILIIGLLQLIVMIRKGKKDKTMTPQVYENLHELNYGELLSAIDRIREKLYEDGADVALTATRFGLNHDSDNPADWNTAPTENTDKQVTYYRSLVIAGPSEKGQALAAKINNGEKLTAEDVKGATWGISSNTTSPAGYIYPSLWLQENFGLSITDLPNKVALDNYATSLTQLASGQIDVMVTYADARLDYADKWTTEMGRTASIWDETNVIGVTAPIYNDTISVTKNSDIMTPELTKALQNAFINIANTPEGQEVISIYSHKGYEIGDSKNYEDEKKAQELIKSMQ